MGTLNSAWHHILAVLLDYLLTVAITLIVIDRWMAWRERRRWRRVRLFVHLQLEALLGDLLRAWVAWLSAVRSQGKHEQLSPEAVAWLRDKNLPTTTSLPPEDFEAFLEMCAGEPIPSAERSFIDETHPRRFHEELVGYLVNVSLDSSSIAWRRLVRILQRMVPKLTDLVHSVPEKEVSSDAINYRQLMEGMNLLIRRINPTLYNREAWDSEIVRLERAEDIAYNIVGVIMLIKVLRLSR